MRRSGRVLLLGLVTVLSGALQLETCRADEFQFAFTGEVTSIENDSGFFTAPATVGAAVSGTFTYTDTPHDGSDLFSPFVTFYLNDRSVAPVTDLVLRIGGVEARSSVVSLTNVAVGNDNEDPLPPSFPGGDFYRYVDELDADSPLFDFSGANLPQFPFGNIMLADSTGTAFTSQDVPADLPIADFDQANGNILLTDENSEFTGRLEFRIDSLQAIPEPTTGMLLLVMFLAIVGVAAMRPTKLNHRSE
jgi:hypothetical protein